MVRELGAVALATNHKPPEANKTTPPAKTKKQNPSSKQEKLKAVHKSIQNLMELELERPQILLEVLKRHRRILDNESTGRSVLKDSFDENTQGLNGFHIAVAQEEELLRSFLKDLANYSEGEFQKKKRYNEAQKKYKQLKQLIQENPINENQIIQLGIELDKKPADGIELKSINFYEAGFNKLADIASEVDSRYLDDVCAASSETIECILKLRQIEKEKEPAAKNLAILHAHIHEMQLAYTRLRNSDDFKNTSSLKDKLKPLRILLSSLELEFVHHVERFHNDQKKQNSLRTEINSARRAKNQEIEKSLPDYKKLAIWHANKYFYTGGPYTKREIDDLQQDALLGLLEAFYDYDLENGAEFSTFSFYRMKAKLSRNLAQKDQSIRLPVEILKKYRELKEEFYKYIVDENIDNKDLSAYEDAKEEFARAYNKTREGRSKNKIYKEDLTRALFWAEKSLDIANYYQLIPNTETDLKDLSDEENDPENNLPDRVTNMWRRVVDTLDESYKFSNIHEGQEPYQGNNSNELKNRINNVLKTLSYREREVLKLRYGLSDDGCTYTLEEIGEIFKVTRERIRQIEAKAIRKLQQPSRSQELAGFIN